MSVTVEGRSHRPEKSLVGHVSERGAYFASSNSARVRVSGKFLWKGDTKFFLKGLTYGPFAPNQNGEYFASVETTRSDFGRIAGDLGANTIRTYYAPPEWLLDEAEAAGLHVLVDIPWPKHLCFLDDRQARQQALDSVRTAARRGAERNCILAYSIGNEIPANIVRWQGAKRTERFLGELADAARQENPNALLTYANYPSTEFLDTSFLDFQTFNVYLQNESVFKRYLLRLQNQVGDMPLILGEFGLDTFRNGEQAQADTLAWHIRAVREAGLAGTTVYSWTDDWFTGGHQIEDWAFGITQADRSPKPAYYAVQKGFALSPSDLLGDAPPRVSVVVCSYNGARTLEQCLDSLQRVDYPDYEVILVDDGSTDNTRQIAKRFPEVKAIHQENKGLSEARNVGLYAATGSIVAYTDSDCFADPDWLTYLVLKMQQTGTAGVGGPNLTPDDGPLASWVSVSPGQPTHVLISDVIAEHVPGCNMAFLRSALEEIHGFDADYRAAGDDVDLCWRLQEAGHQISFAPAATVWHHRRQNIATYLKQQKGYGHAEGLLRFKHPDKFNARGDSLWHGTMYGMNAWGIRIGKPIIHHGVFGTGLFQTLYAQQPAHWIMLPASLEWLLAAVLLMLLSPFYARFGFFGLGMVQATLVVALVQAIQAPIPAHCRSLRGRLVLLYLCLAQPLVRSLARYLCRFRGKHVRMPATVDIPAWSRPFVFLYRLDTAYWGEAWQERAALLENGVRLLAQRGFTYALDSGWMDWDMEVFCGSWTKLQVRTVEEDHGGGHRLVRVRYRLKPTLFARSLLLFLGLSASLLAVHNPIPAAVLAAGSLAGFGLFWQRSVRSARYVIQIFENAAMTLGYWRRPWRGRKHEAEEAPDLTLAVVSTSVLDSTREVS